MSTPTPMRRAFVSHSSADDRYVAEMKSFLKAAGFGDVFNDVSSIKPDEKFWPKIEEGITNCDSFVVVITAASNASEWVKREVEFARSLSKNVIPVWIEDCPLPATFTERDVIDFRPGTREERRFDIGRIVKYAPAELIGREEETRLLDESWQKTLRLEKGRPHVLTFVALGGEGKTSLVAKWAADLAAQDWPGCDAVFAWSFYSQGTRDPVAASSDLFLKEALTFFGDEQDKAFAASPAGAFEKGQRLARIVGQRRCLLILDGLEPLQYAPTSPTPGELKDQGLAALLKGLAATSHGLCVVTTRYAIPDLRAFLGKTVREEKLMRLSQEAGVALLRKLGVRGTAAESAQLVEDVRGHALTLNLLGSYLRDAHGGDIRKRGLVKLADADAEEQGGHAFRVMDAYAKSFESEGEKGRRALALLCLLGLFDRPATADCLGALWTGEAITGLTEPLVGLSEEQRNLTLQRLEDGNLLTVQRDEATGVLMAVDAHPLLREYFAVQLKTNAPAAWKAGHRRLYEHLCASTNEGTAPTLEDLQPLYQAVAHGCYAGLQQEAYDRTYSGRILRGHQCYSLHKLGVFGSDLGAVACFFDEPWSRLNSSLSHAAKASLLGITPFNLRALGRLREALQPMQAVLELDIKDKHWKNAAYSANNLSELEQTLGEVALAERDAAQSVTYADHSGDAFPRMCVRATHADALHQAGRRAEAETRFREAEQMQPVNEPECPLLYSLRGFQYCDLLLAEAERAAWRAFVVPPSGGLAGRGRPPEGGTTSEEQAAICRAVSQRAAPTLKWVESLQLDVISAALDHLTLGRAALYAAMLTSGGVPPPDPDDRCRPAAALWEEARRELDSAVTGLRRAGTQQYIPLGLLTRAWLRFLEGRPTGPDSAQSDLDEAWEIAERGPMKLHMADIHLYRARLFGRGEVSSDQEYPWESPEHDLAEARKLIEKCGYGRRREELEDAVAAIL